MNIGPRKHPDAGIEPIDEHEWQAQERALREERAGDPASADDPLLAGYRQVARALRRPLPDAPPPAFARSVAARAAAEHAAPDMRLEQGMLRALALLLGGCAIAAVALYGGQWLPGFVALLPPGAGATTLNWALALGACLGLSWTLEHLRRGLPQH